MPKFAPTEFTGSTAAGASGFTLGLRDMKNGQCIVLSINAAKLRGVAV